MRTANVCKCLLTLIHLHTVMFPIINDRVLLGVNQCNPENRRTSGLTEHGGERPAINITELFSPLYEKQLCSSNQGVCQIISALRCTPLGGLWPLFSCRRRLG